MRKCRTVYTRVPTLGRVRPAVVLERKASIPTPPCSPFQFHEYFHRAEFAIQYSILRLPSIQPSAHSHRQERSEDARPKTNHIAHSHLTVT